jgi:hypothetical protein
MKVISSWTVKRKDGKGTRSRCMAECGCGNISEYDKSNVDRGNTKRCRKCANESRGKKHSKHGCSISNKSANKEGYSNYTIWQAMKRRCYLETAKSYSDYGGRGIKVCDSWLNSFDNFISDMGYRPTSKHEIDRIDTNGDYSPDNCRWATKKENARNKRNTVRLAIDGVTKPLVEWAEVSGESCGNIKNRIRNLGWSNKEAVFGKKKRRVYNTPKGKFQTLEEISFKFDVGISAISRRFKSESFPEWHIE